MSISGCIIFHNWGWPQKGIEVCTRCGAKRKAQMRFPVKKRFAIPRNSPKVTAEVLIFKKEA